MPSPRAFVQVVEPPSLRSELSLLLRLALPVVGCAALWLAWERAGRAPEAGGAALDATGLPTVAFADLGQGEQRLFRQIQEGLLEAENARARYGAWPGVAELAAEGIPPFAEDPLDPASPVWMRLERGLTSVYFGSPRQESGGPVFAVVILEPPPGTPVDPRATADEVHHLLPDGRMLHVTVWIGPPGSRPEEALAAPTGLTGWRRITLASSKP